MDTIKTIKTEGFSANGDLIVSEILAVNQDVFVDWVRFLKVLHNLKMVNYSFSLTPMANDLGDYYIHFHNIE